MSHRTNPTKIKFSKVSKINELITLFNLLSNGCVLSLLGLPDNFQAFVAMN